MQLYQPTITGSLSVSGSINLTGSLTLAGGGTISGTASIATNALTASSADNFLVRNTLTAQTLVVQTITSSVSTITGSTNFGSLAANTHTFTGSIITSGSVGINATPDNTYQGLTIVGSNPSLRLKGNQASAWTWIEFVSSSNANNFSMGVNHTTPYFGIKAGAGMDSTNFTMLANGNIGIGMTNPQTSLHIIRALGSDVFAIGESSTNMRFRIGQEASYTGNYIQSTNIDLKLMTYLAGGTGGNIIFQTGASDIGSLTERMRISSDGSTNFVFRNSSNEVMDLKMSTETASPSKSKISLMWYGNETTSIKFRRGDDATGGNLEFWTMPTGGAITQRMIINSGGDIRIGDSAGADGRVMIRTSSAVGYAPNSYNGTFANIRFMTGGTAATNITTGLSLSIGGSAEAYIGAVQNSSGYADVVIQTYHASYSEKIRIYSNGATQIYNLAGSGTRTVTADASGILAASSDSSLKQEDTTHQIEGLAEILQLQPRAYKWLSDIEKRGEEATTEIGFFANEVASIIPSAAPKNHDGLYGFYDRAVIAALVKGMQELKEEFDTYKATHP